MTRFSLIGPLRTGSSLLARCIDDHPQLICLCESEINRALFGEYFLKLHFQRMLKHGLRPIEIAELLDRKNQNSSSDYEKWHNQLLPIVKTKYKKETVKAMGDKSPDFYRTPSLARHLELEHRLIYTIRDPRAVYRSIQADQTPQVQKDQRWAAFLANTSFWKNLTAEGDVLVVRFEDLVASPEEQMNRIYEFLGAEESTAFQESFPRFFPERFLWKNVTEKADSGVSFVNNKVSLWKEELSVETISRLQKDDRVVELLQRFEYD